MKKFAGDYYCMTVNGNIYNGLSRDALCHVLRLLKNHRQSTVISYHIYEYGTYIYVMGLNDPKARKALRFLEKEYADN